MTLLAGDYLIPSHLRVTNEVFNTPTPDSPIKQTAPGSLSRMGTAFSRAIKSGLESIQSKLGKKEEPDPLKDFDQLYGEGALRTTRAWQELNDAP